MKMVTVVNDDIDVWNYREVEWAIASRVQADRDVIVVPWMHTIPLDPSAKDSTTAKMGIDATKPFNIPPERYERSDGPKNIREKVEKEWDKYFA